MDLGFLYIYRARFRLVWLHVWYSSLGISTSPDPFLTVNRYMGSQTNILCQNPSPHDDKRYADHFPLGYVILYIYTPSSQCVIFTSNFYLG